MRTVIQPAAVWLIAHHTVYSRVNTAVYTLGKPMRIHCEEISKITEKKTVIGENRFLRTRNI